MSSYEKPEEGEWVRPVKEGYKMACCDCGLVHKVDFRVVGEESDCNVTAGFVPEFRMYRDNRATGQVRRHMKLAACVESDEE